MPDQIVLPTGVTSDLRYTNIAVSRDFYDKLVQMCPYTRRASIFRRRPPCLLTEEQFSSVLDAVNLIRTLSRMESVHRLSQLAHLLDILLCMLHDFHVANYPDEKSEKESLFTTFYEHLTIQQISHRLGFTEQSSFSRYFKASTGMTPSEYRRKC